MGSAAAMAKEGARRPRRFPARPWTKPVDNDRDETLGRYALVVLMPAIVIATTAAIMFYLTLPLR